MSSEEIQDDYALEDYINRLNEMDINELVYEKIHPIEGLKSKFGNWVNAPEKQGLKLKFTYAPDFKRILPKDLLVMEIRETDDLYNSYIRGYQKLLFYEKDIIDKNKSPDCSLIRQLDWYKKACGVLLGSDLKVLDTIRIRYSWSLTNDTTNEKFSGSTSFYLYHYPPGLFQSNNILPTTVWNRIIFRYPFMDNDMCFVPSITRSWSNSDKTAKMINAEFNKLLLSIIRFTEREHDKIYLNDESVDTYIINSAVSNDNIKLEMTLDVHGNEIATFDYRLLPFPTEYASYYVNSFGPELFDMQKVEVLIARLRRVYIDDLESYGYSRDLFDCMLRSFYVNTGFNISILWWFIKDNTASHELIHDLMFNMADNIERILKPNSELEKRYYLSKIEIVSTIMPEDISWLAPRRETDISQYYTFSEIVHILNELLVQREGHFYFRHQSYSDISSAQNKDSQPNRKKESQTDSQLDQQQTEPHMKKLDDIAIVFSYLGTVYQCTIKDLFERGYLNLSTIFSLQKCVIKRLYFDYDECVNYVYYLNGLLQNKYQNKNTLLYTFSTLFNIYGNDMKTLYIIGESQCGKSVFKNIMLSYMGDYYEKTNIGQSEFNYEDAHILKIYDDVDIMNKSKSGKTHVILDRDNYTVSINEKNKSPIRIYKTQTNLVLNNDWPKITTWYHQRRIKTCLFATNSRSSLKYALDRIFKSENRCVGSFNDVFINNFFQYVISYRDDLYHDGVYYSDCSQLLDQKLPLQVLEENIKNILNLDTVNEARSYISFIGENITFTLKQQFHPIVRDYCLKQKFALFI